MELLTQNNVGLAHLLGQNGGIVKVTFDDLDIGVLGSNLVALGSVSDEGADAVLGMGLGQDVESLTTNVARGAGAVDVSVSGELF